MTAIETFPDDIEIIAFVDADATIERDWLTLLVQPLQDKQGRSDGGSEILFSAYLKYSIACRGSLDQFSDSVARRSPIPLWFGAAPTRSVVNPLSKARYCNVGTTQLLKTTI